VSTTSTDTATVAGMQPRELERETPPVGEEIHVPGPSVLPPICAIAITLMVIGTTIGWLWTIIGAIIFIVTVVIWVRGTNRDIAELPEDHAH
jgi:hypothetical protein